MPYPYATADHQTTNAQAWVASGAAFMIADADVEGAEFASRVLDLVDDADMRATMRAQASAADSVNAAARLADAVEAASI